MQVQILVSGSLTGEELKIDKNIEGTDEDILRIQDMLKNIIKIIKQGEAQDA